MYSLAKNISANFLSNLWLTVLSLILTPLYIGFLGVESYGLIGFYLSWLAILGILDTSISTTAVREIAWFAARPQEKGKMPILLRSLEVTYWLIILILGVGILFGAWFFGEGWFQANELPPQLIRDALMLMAVSLVAQVPSGLYVAGLMGLGRQVECSCLLAIFGAVRGFGAIAVLWLISPDIRLFFIWQAIASVLQTGVLRWVLWESIRVEGSPSRFSFEVLHSVKGFAGGMMLTSIISIVMFQADKMILSRLVSLTEFGYYTLAWTVASGLSRVAGPVTDAFGPHITGLISKGDEKGLAKYLPLASQLMSALTMPLTFVIAFLATPILFVWLGNRDVAEGVAPILSVMIMGIMLISCSYPAFSVLYARRQIKLVVFVHLTSTILVLPLLILAVARWGVMGGASTWVLYGSILYLTSHVFGLRGIPGAGFPKYILKNFFIPCGASLVVAWLMGRGLNTVDGKLGFVALLGLALLVCGAVVLFVCRDLFEAVAKKLKWQFKEVL